MIGTSRLAYADNHIESDHYLAWFLGRLDAAYGARAYYVHLTRNLDACAQSWAAESPYWMGSPATAFRHAFLMMTREPYLDTCREFVITANENIRVFLKDKPNRMNFALETAQSDWPRFWRWIGAAGDYEASIAEWGVHYNATLSRTQLFRRNLCHRLQHIYRAIVPR
jgi:hypothetical protein